MNRRRALGALALGVVAPAALAACSEATNTLEQVVEPEAPPEPSLTFTPALSATGVGPRALVKVEVRDGVLRQVALTNPATGRVVAGNLDPEGSTFTLAEPLGYGTQYSWSGSAIGEDGKTVPVAGSFTTLAPAYTVSGRYQLADHQTVGVAAPIILQFDAAIAEEHRAEVERALTVTTTPEVEGSWGWLPDEVGGSRMHWRTREYYPAGTVVHVDANFYGVPFGENAYGAADSTLDFTIGRYQLVRGEASSHRIQVLTGAGIIMDFPCSYGEGDLDRNVTRSGIHVVTEKYEDFYMTNPAAGYANSHQRWAVRISNNGEFIHANPASSGAQGNTNVTNGCINLSPTDAEQYFNTAMYGDPVEITGTRLELSYGDGDIWDWTVPWPQWLAMSAIDTDSSAMNLPSSAPVTPTDAPVPAAPPGG